EREKFEERSDLYPAPVDPLWLEQDEPDQDRAEDRRLDPGDGDRAATDERTQQVPRHRNRLRQQSDHSRTKERAVNRSEPADDDGQQQLDRDDDVEGLVVEDAREVAHQRAGKAADAG